MKKHVLISMSLDLNWYSVKRGQGSQKIGEIDSLNHSSFVES